METWWNILSTWFGLVETPYQVGWEVLVRRRRDRVPMSEAGLFKAFESIEVAHTGKEWLFNSLGNELEHSQGISKASSTDHDDRSISATISVLMC